MPALLPRSEQVLGTDQHRISPAARESACWLLLVVVVGRRPGLTTRGQGSERGEGREKRTGHRTDGGSRGNVSWFRCRCRRPGLRIDKRLLKRRGDFDLG